VSKPAIPRVATGSPAVDQAIGAIKQTLDEITGQARSVDKMTPLATTATLVQVIERLNEIVARMQ
jgi:hypothetical protein